MRSFYSRPFPIGLALFGLAVMGCKDQPSGAETASTASTTVSSAGSAVAAPSAEAVKEAGELFVSRCVPCHGATGAGDGPTSKTLNPKPASFSSPEWQKSVTDEHVEKIILYGGMAVGKSVAMPPNPDLQTKPEVITALRLKVRSLKK